MTATVFRQSYMTQRPSLFTLNSYCAIVFSFALMFANGWFTAWDGFCGASACWLSITHYYYHAYGMHPLRFLGACVWFFSLFVWYSGLLLALYNYNDLVGPGLSFVQFLGSFSLGLFCVLVVFPAALPYTVRLVRRLQYQFTRSW